MKGLLLGGFAAIGTGSGAMLALHAGAGLDPMYSVISEYAWASVGWLLPTSLTLFAVGAALVAAALRRAGAGPWVVGLLVAWGICMFLIGAFPTDKPGVPLSLSGGIHRYAAFGAFLVMPVAGLLVARARVRYARQVKVLCGVALSALLVVVVPYVVQMCGLPFAGVGVPAGLTQRVVVVTEVAVLALIAMSLLDSRTRNRAGVRLKTS
ncbi:DUF998 domain-containing protein [Nonomuraea longicatena]|uniref:DUF998 domain-containing protein n=1 Tax=Nonomuraea longicatena TaxID=83682 RepID=A0ABP3Z4S0_9ACTN